MSFAEVTRAITDGGMIVLLMAGIWLIVLGAHKGWWVPGPIYQAALKERDEWQRQAKRAIAVAEQFTKWMGSGEGKR